MPPAADRGRRLAHYAAPALFLLAVTVAVLLIRWGLESGTSKPATTVAATKPPPTTTRRTHRRPPHAQYYTVQSGDTFGSISARTGVPVAQLEQLNPGVSSNALRVGQKLRVK